MLRKFFSHNPHTTRTEPSPPSCQPPSKPSRLFPTSFRRFQYKNGIALKAINATLSERLKAYVPPPGVRNNATQPASGIAMDSTLNHAVQRLTSWASIPDQRLDALITEGTGFLGYPFLAELAQRAEFRKPCDIIAREATREWIALRITPNPRAPITAEKAASLCQKLEAEMQRLHMRNIVRRMIEQSLAYGLSHIWINLKDHSHDSESQSLPLFLNPHSIAIGSLEKFSVIEPIWTTPEHYNSNNPLADDYYRPSTWWVQGIRVHHSRLVSMVPYEVSDLFKPAFNFGGLSLTQQILPYVRNFLRIRNSVANITTNFSKLVLKTNLAGNLQHAEGLDYNDLSSESLQGRAALLHDLSDGQNTIIADKEAEDVDVISTPLTGLSDLQSQAMEAMASIPGIPLVKLFGIQPTGLNASSEGELRVFYDEINAFQKAHIAPVIHRLLEVIQLNLWGSINPSIDFDFVPLWQMDAKETANIEKTKAETDEINIRNGKISPQEARLREGADTHSLYRHMPLSS